MSEPVEAQLQAAADRAIELASVQAGDRVLDVCCGTGNAAATSAAAGAAAEGIDLDERALEAARRRVPSGLFHVADAAQMPFADASFDVAVSVFGVSFAPGERAVGELLRVVRPGGRIVITTWPRDGSILSAGGIVGRALAEAQPARSAAPSLAPWHDRGALRRLFAPHRVGFSDEQIVFHAPSARAVACEYYDHHPLWLAAREVLGESTYEELRAEAVRFLCDVNEDPCAWRATGRYLATVVKRCP